MIKRKTAPESKAAPAVKRLKPAAPAPAPVAEDSGDDSYSGLSMSEESAEEFGFDSSGDRFDSELSADEHRSTRRSSI